jgi:hypothetical protein
MTNGKKRQNPETAKPELTQHRVTGSADTEISIEQRREQMAALDVETTGEAE